MGDEGREAHLSRCCTKAFSTACRDLNTSLTRLSPAAEIASFLCSNSRTLLDASFSCDNPQRPDEPFP